MALALLGRLEQPVAPSSAIRARVAIRVRWIPEMCAPKFADKFAEPRCLLELPG
jgi:hypothetical protein